MCTSPVLEALFNSIKLTARINHHTSLMEWALRQASAVPPSSCFWISDGHTVPAINDEGHTIPSNQWWGSHSLSQDIGLHTKKRNVLSKRIAGPPRAETTCKREGGKPIRSGHGSTRETWLQNQLESALWIYHVSYCASKLKYSVLQLNGDKIAFSGFWRKHHKVLGTRVRRL